MNKSLISDMNKILKFIEMFHNKDMFVTVFADHHDDIHLDLRGIFCTYNETHKVRWHPCDFFYEDSNYNIRIDHSENYNSIQIDSSKMMSEHFINVKIGYSNDEIRKWIRTVGIAWKDKHYKRSKRPVVIDGPGPSIEATLEARNHLMKMGVSVKEINRDFPLIKRVK